MQLLLVQQHPGTDLLPGKTFLVDWSPPNAHHAFIWGENIFINHAFLRHRRFRTAGRRVGWFVVVIGVGQQQPEHRDIVQSVFPFSESGLSIFGTRLAGNGRRNGT